MLMALNTRGFNHRTAYGYENAVMDADFNQLDRAKVAYNKVNEIVRFSYDEKMYVVVESFNNIGSIDISVQDYHYQEQSPKVEGILFTGELVSKETMLKSSVAILYPKAINKRGHFNQFTLKMA